MQANTIEQKDAPSQMSGGRGGQFISKQGVSACLCRQKSPKSGYFDGNLATFPLAQPPPMCFWGYIYIINDMLYYEQIFKMAMG
jgi:hypothetical protein